MWPRHVCISLVLKILRVKIGESVRDVEIAKSKLSLQSNASAAVEDVVPTVARLRSGFTKPLGRICDCAVLCAIAVMLDSNALPDAVCEAQSKIALLGLKFIAATASQCSSAL